MKHKAEQMKHINLDAADEQVKQFVLSLDVDPDGSVLELEGKEVLRVMPMTGDAEREKLKAAILARRDTSRALNEDWEHADREVWNQLPADQQ